MAGAISPADMLRLYRNILKAAQRFPSIKRGQILEDIKAEFRANRALTDTAAVAEARRSAIRSLEQLQAYAGIDATNDEWQLSLKGACD